MGTLGDYQRPSFYFSIIFFAFLLFCFFVISFFSSHSRWISSFPVFTTQMTASTRKIPWLKRRTRIPARKNCPKSETSTKPIVICALRVRERRPAQILKSRQNATSRCQRTPSDVHRARDARHFHVAQPVNHFLTNATGRNPRILLAHKKAEHAALSNKSDKGSKPRNELGTRSVTSGFSCDLVPYRFSFERFERFERHYTQLKTGMLVE